MSLIDTSKVSYRVYFALAPVALVLPIALPLGLEAFFPQPNKEPLAFVSPFLLLSWLLCLFALYQGLKQLRKKQHEETLEPIAMQERDALEPKMKQDRDDMVKKYGDKIADDI